MCTALENFEKESIQEGKLEGIQAMIAAFRELAIPEETLLQKLQDKFNLNQQEAENYMNS